MSHRVLSVYRCIHTDVGYNVVESCKRDEHKDINDINWGILSLFLYPTLIKPATSTKFVFSSA